MNSVFVRRSFLALASVASLTLVIACSDKRIKNLDTGITRDSALTIIAQDMRQTGGPDSLPNVYTRDRYLIGGKNYEVMYYTRNNEKAGKDSVPFSKLTPMVFVENKLIGRGWAFLDSLSKANNIPLKQRD
jgi:hypothetical protein